MKPQIIHMDSSLRRLAAIALSQELWWYSDLDKTLRHCIDDDLPAEDHLPSTALEVVDNFIIPKPVRDELLFVIGAMGKDIWNLKCRIHEAYSETTDRKPSVWLGYLVWNPWGHHGRVDYRRTIETTYKSLQLPVTGTTWLELCHFCLEDCITHVSSTHPVEIYQDAMSTYAQVDSNHFMFARVFSIYWIYHVSIKPDMTRIMRQLLEQLPYGFYDATRSLDENMFLYSVVGRQDYPIEYFWQMLEEDEQIGIISFISEKIMADDTRSKCFEKVFLSSDTLRHHSLVFFINQLALKNHEEARIKLLGSGFVLRELLDWTHYGSFMRTMTEACSHHESINFGPLMSKLCRLVGECVKHGFVQRDEHWRKIFSKIWMMNPSNLKKSVDYSDVLTVIWKQKDMELLTYVLTDPELVERRKEFLAVLVKAYERNDENDAFLRRFTEKFFDSDDEQKAFRYEVEAKYEE